MSDLLVANVRYLHGADDRPLAGWLRVENGVIVDGGAGDAPAAGGAASFDGGGCCSRRGMLMCTYTAGWAATRWTPTRTR
ncbi:MAG: hypothetical protein HND48_16145 [Chloroflexi bacterium]|nr:hypothetical protein [Chloroflexota bacterium]